MLILMIIMSVRSQTHLMGASVSERNLKCKIMIRLYVRVPIMLCAQRNSNLPPLALRGSVR